MEAPIHIRDAIKILNVESMSNLDSAYAIKAKHANEYDKSILDQAYEMLWDFDGPWPEVEKPAPEPKQTKKKVPARINKIIAAIKEIPDLDPEICGNWLWIGGSTKEHRAILKNLGLRWSRKKEKWYWHPPGYRKRGKKEFSMPEIRNKYGSRNIEE